MNAPLHPAEALFKGEKPFPVIPACDHYAGSEKLMRRALGLQDSIGPVFDVTCDCEDGAQAGAETQHAEMIVRVLNGPANKHKMAGARIHGPGHAHNLTLELKDSAVVRDDARRTRKEFGFLRRWSIYPAQIQPIVDAMQPDHSEVEHGTAILLAAQQAGWGPIQYANELHDRATYRYYWDVLQKARATGAPIPAEADRVFFG